MEIRASGRASAEPSAVWQVLSDLVGWPDWTPTVTEVRPAGGADAPSGVGATFSVKQPRLPRATWVVTDWQPGAGFTWESRTPGLVSTATHYLTPDGTGTRIELALRWAGPLTPVVSGVWGRLSRRYVQTELDCLVAASEQARA